MTYGFIKACTVSPALRVADCPYNTQMTIEAMQKAASDGVQLAVFPELGLTGYTCGDLFLQQPLQKAAEAAGACQKVLLTRSQTENASPVFRLKILRAAAHRICLQTAHKFCTCGTGRFARRSRRRAKPIGILIRARGCRCCEAGACVLRPP